MKLWAREEGGVCIASEVRICYIINIAVKYHKILGTMSFIIPLFFIPLLGLSEPQP